MPRNRKLKGIKTARDEVEELDRGLVKGRFPGSRRQVSLSQPQGGEANTVSGDPPLM